MADLLSQIAALTPSNAPTLAIGAPQMGGGMPALPAAAMPSVVRLPTQTEMDQGELNRRINSGAGVDQIQNPLLHGIAKAGDIALSVFGGISPIAHAIGAAIPGTTGHHQLLVHQQQQLVADDQAQQQRAQQLADEQAQAEQTKALTSYTQQRPAIETAKLQQKQTLAQQKIGQLAAAHGQTVTFDEDGTPTFADDTNSEAYQRNKVLDEVHKSKQELQDAQAAFTQARSDPNSPLFRQTEQRLAIAQQNANAAGTRAQAYMANYLKGAYNTGLDGAVLPGAPQIQDEHGNITTPGSTNAGAASKANAAAAKMNDVHGALDAMDAAAEALVQSGGSLNSPGIIYAMQHAHGTTSQFVQSLDKANLSQQERAYVTALQAGHENIQALRGTLGSGATDSQINRLDAMIPDGTTPDLNYFKTQTGQIRATATRLGSGVTTAKGGLSVHNGGAAGGLKVGDVEDGYEYLGGDKGKQTSWKKVN